MDLKFIESNEAFGERDHQAYQVVSLEDPYHPKDVGFAISYDKAVEIAKEYDKDGSTSEWGGQGMRIYEILIQG